MTRITIDDELPQKLLHALSAVELCDASGNVIGTFTPRIDLAALEAECQVDYEELQRRLRDDTFISTAEVLERLGKP